MLNPVPEAMLAARYPLPETRSALGETAAAHDAAAAGRVGKVLIDVSASA